VQEKFVPGGILGQGQAVPALVPGVIPAVILGLSLVQGLAVATELELEINQLQWQ